jgi:cellulose synthase/poly-beta-1,6-N-acetylglucosamine synthase-like glycosyltransferase
MTRPSSLDFLYKTIPYLRSNPRAGFVQSRWVYTNGDESILTRVQEISLNYHIRQGLIQPSNSSACLLPTVF